MKCMPSVLPVGSKISKAGFFISGSLRDLENSTSYVKRAARSWDVLMTYSYCKGTNKPVLTLADSYAQLPIVFR